MSGLRIILKRNFDMVDVNAHFYLGTFWGFFSNKWNDACTASKT